MFGWLQATPKYTAAIKTYLAIIVLVEWSIAVNIYGDLLQEFLVNGIFWNSFSFIGYCSRKYEEIELPLQLRSKSH